MTQERRRQIWAFTDGACSGNPGPGGWGAVLLTPDNQVLEIGGGEAHTTNNRMEMQAALEVLRATDPSVPLRLMTDSNYLVQGITSWIHGWRKRGWRKSGGDEILNPEIWKALYNEVHTSRRAPRIDWVHVRGHVGIPGNERVDRIAVAYSQGQEPALFEGDYNDYFVDLLAELPASTGGSSKKSGTKTADSSPRRNVYLSYVHGELLEHNDWASCQRRVHGQSGARYKKCKTEQEVRDTLQKWGLSPDALS